jgi:hypothetical protein
LGTRCTALRKLLKTEKSTRRRAWRRISGLVFGDDGRIFGLCPIPRILGGTGLKFGLIGIGRTSKPGSFEGLLLGFSAGTASIVLYRLQYSTVEAEVKLSARVGRLALSRLVSFGEYSAIASAAFNGVFNKVTGKPLTEKFSFLSSVLYFGVTLFSQFLSKKRVLETQKKERSLAQLGLPGIDVSLVAFFANAFFNAIRNQNSLLGCLGVFCKFLIGLLPY